MILGGSIIGDDYLWRAGKSLSRVAVRAISPSWEQCTCALWRTTLCIVHCAQWSVENKGGQCTVDEQACPVHSGEQQCGQGNEALNKSHFVICVHSLYFIYCCNHPKIAIECKKCKPYMRCFPRWSMCEQSENTYNCIFSSHFNSAYTHGWTTQLWRPSTSSRLLVWSKIFIPVQYYAAM